MSTHPRIAHVVYHFGSGLPVITSVLGDNGAPIAPGDDVALAHTLLDYAADAERRRREGTAARQRIERDFSLLRMAAAYQEVYETALAP